MIYDATINSSSRSPKDLDLVAANVEPFKALIPFQRFTQSRKLRDQFGEITDTIHRWK